MKIVLLLILFVFSTNPMSQDNPRIYLDIENQRNIAWHISFIAALRAQANMHDITLTRITDTTLPRLTVRFPGDDGPVRIALEPAASPSPLLSLELTLQFTNWTVEMLRASMLYLAERCDALPEQMVPDNAFILSIMQMNCAIQTGDYDKAIDIYERINVLTDDRLHFNAAWLYLQTANPAKAFEIMADVIDHHQQRHPADHIRALTYRAQLYALNFDYDAAISDMDAAIALDSENPELYVLRGQMVLLLYEWDRVEADYNTALEIDPNYAPAYYYRGILYYTVLERENALADFEQYLELAPAGDHATDAARYAESIRAELDALGGD